MKVEQLTRFKKIEKGKIWTVCYDGTPDDILFEGTLSACRQYLRDHGLMRDWREGKVRTGKVIWEEGMD